MNYIQKIIGNEKKIHVKDIDPNYNIIFYDNDAERIEQVRQQPNIFCQQIDDSIPNELYKRIKSKHNNATDLLQSSHFFNEYTTLFGKNTFTDFLLETQTNSLETFMPCEGFNTKHKEQLFAWLDSRKIMFPRDKHIMVFDWDRTLSQYEGVYTSFLNRKNRRHKYRSKYYDYNYDIVVYLLGGKERLEILKDMFNKIYKKGGIVYICTNNPIASVTNNISRNEFIKIIRKIVVHFKGSHLLCSCDEPMNDKGITICKAVSCNYSSLIERNCNSITQKKYIRRSCMRKMGSRKKHKNRKS
jgi:hypothetical protein